MLGAMQASTIARRFLTPVLNINMQLRRNRRAVDEKFSAR